MTIPTFPDGLPRPLVASYGRQRFDPRRKTSYDAGPPSYDLRYTAVPVMHTLSMRLWAWQTAVLERFHIEDCREGTLPFYMRDYSIDGLPILDEAGVPLLDSDGVPLLMSKVMLCLWGDAPPSWGSPVTTRQVVSFTVLEMP
jgi:hypothetical protein